MGTTLLVFLGFFALLAYAVVRVLAWFWRLLTGAPGPSAENVFFRCAFSAMGHVCKADGRVSEEEILQAKSIMERDFRMPLAACLQAQDYFRAGTRPDYDLDETLETMAGLRELHEAFMEIQVVAACADGTLSPSEMEVLRRCCAGLGFSAERMQAMCDRILGPTHAGQNRDAQDLDWAYGALGVLPSDSDRDIRQAYARKMKEFHPDKLMSKGLPQDLMEFASERTKEITRAYQQIKQARGRSA